MILGQFADNYADEFDVYGWKILTKDEYAVLQERVAGFFPDHEFES